MEGETVMQMGICLGGTKAKANVLTLACRYHEAPEGSTTDKTAEYFLGRRTAVRFQKQETNKQISPEEYKNGPSF